MIASLTASMFASGLRSIRNAMLDNPAMSPQDPATWAAMQNGPEADAGVRVSHTSALTVPAVWQAVSMISGDMAGMTLNVNEQLPEDDRKVATDHPWQFAVSSRWNRDTSAFEGWRRCVAHACLWHNGYALICPPLRGEPAELVNLLPDRTAPRYDSRGNLFYLTEINGELKPIPKAAILHVKGLSLDCSQGYDLITAARNAVGLAIAAQGYASRFFSNGSQSGGYLEVPPNWKDQAVKNLEEGWYRKYTGKDNWFKTVILRDGAKFHQSTIDAQKSQLQETREGQAREVARIFNMPPFKLGLQDSVAYNSAEMSQLIYLASCLNNWRHAITSECSIKLLAENEQRKGTHFFRHEITNIIELDIATHTEVLVAQRSAEIINANEARQQLGYPKRTDPGGDDYTNPNVKSGGQLGGDEPPAKPGGKPPKEPPPKNRIEAAARTMMRDALDRAVRLVTNRARARAKEPQKFTGWLESDAAEEKIQWDRILSPAAELVALLNDTLPDFVLSGLTDPFFDDLLGKLEPLVEPPYVASKLAANVSAVCAGIEAGAVERLLAAAFNDHQPERIEA